MELHAAAEQVSASTQTAEHHAEAVRNFHSDMHVLTLGTKTYNKRPYRHLYIAPILVDLP